MIGRGDMGHFAIGAAPGATRRVHRLVSRGILELPNND
jgi:hypothetical protein